MDKETLSNYGWIVVCVMVLAVMIALASPFGSYIASAVENTTQGLFDVQQGALSVAGIDIADQSFEGGESSSDAPLILEVGAKVPDNCQYIVFDESGNAPLVDITIQGETTQIPAYVYNAGEQIPNYTQNDALITTDYIYNYDGEVGGWGVAVLDQTKTEYGAILESINGQPIISMRSALYGCTSLETAPIIPSGATNMMSTFNRCTSLKTAPVIPNSVTRMDTAFLNCTSLETAPIIPNSVTKVDSTFQDCSSLTGTISIPCTLESEYLTYTNCPATIEYYHFEGCGH